MKAGEYLIDTFMPSDWEPKIWTVEKIDRGKVDLSRVNPTNLVRTGERKRVDLYHAKRMLKYDTSDRELLNLVRGLYQYRSQVRRYIDTLKSEVQEESGG